MSSPMPDLSDEQLQQASIAMAREALIEAVLDFDLAEEPEVHGYRDPDLLQRIDKAATDLVYNLRPDGCFYRAEPGEPTFTLLARDPVAPETITTWVKLRRQKNIDPPYDPRHPEALQVATAMQVWREKNR